MPLKGNAGSVREALVTAMISEAGHKVEAHRDEIKGDFVITIDKKKISLEVGGQKKRAKQADFVVRDDTDVPAGKSIPMWALGFLY